MLLAASAGGVEEVVVEPLVLGRDLAALRHEVGVVPLNSSSMGME